MKHVFEAIYKTHIWEHGSGWGSYPENTQLYVQLLNQYMRQHQVKSVVDFGCGDWQFSRFIDWTGINYIGIDVVKHIIDRNQSQFKAPNISFVYDDMLTWSPPVADLAIIKDVFQHWDNASIINFLPKLARFKRCLVTNDRWLTKYIWPYSPNTNCDIGSFQIVDLRYPPFNTNLKVTELLCYPVRDEIKQVVEVIYTSPPK